MRRDAQLLVRGVAHAERSGHFHVQALEVVAIVMVAFAGCADDHSGAVDGAPGLHGRDEGMDCQDVLSSLVIKFCLDWNSMTDQVRDGGDGLPAHLLRPAELVDGLVESFG